MSPTRTLDSETPKTETILKRKIQVYLPSEEKLDDWRSRAKERDISLSKFIIYNMDRSIYDMSAEDILPRRELEKQLEEKQAIITRLDEDNRLLKSLVQRFDTELHGKRAEQFLRPTRKYDKELIDLFQRRGFVRFDELQTSLGIPPGNVDTMKGINAQIDIMVTNSIIEKTSSGWRWNL